MTGAGKEEIAGRRRAETGAIAKEKLFRICGNSKRPMRVRGRRGIPLHVRLNLLKYRRGKHEIETYIWHTRTLPGA